MVMYTLLKVTETVFWEVKSLRKVDLGKIKELRKKEDISLDEMSRKLGYESQNGYYYLEIGRGKFTAEMLAKVADILSVNINSLFFTQNVAKSVIDKPNNNSAKEVG